MIAFNLTLNRLSLVAKQKQICYGMMMTAFMTAIIIIFFFYSYYFYLRQSLQNTIDQLQKRTSIIIAKPQQSLNDEVTLSTASKMTNYFYWQSEMINALIDSNLCFDRIESNESGYILQGYAKNANAIKNYLQNASTRYYFSQLLLNSARPKKNSSLIVFVMQALI